MRSPNGQPSLLALQQVVRLVRRLHCNRCSASTLAIAALSVIDIPWMSEKEFLHGDYVGGSHNPAEQA